MCNRDILTIKAEVNEIFQEKLRGLYARYETKREYEEAIFSELSPQTLSRYASIPSVIQREPFTCVGIKVQLSGDEKWTVGIGFSKCDGVDEWDKEKGVSIATHKAVRHAARQLAGLKECSQ